VQIFERRFNRFFAAGPQFCDGEDMRQRFARRVRRERIATVTQKFSR
jgi:hypothetical protein